ncbi:hypothetical protein EX30DRAFT_374241 [Ascodesmis nigricans]|uniref:WLM domain-containing protein n=1 Tax=Ascodesmis nigricans TaxID=341454 RepID=A0A4S2MLM9_9PEZI|nr:hypothetical protein EX30DRAFT_374241 [Ascodesmis nigricans]
MFQRPILPAAPSLTPPPKPPIPLHGHSRIPPLWRPITPLHPTALSHPTLYPLRHLPRHDYAHLILRRLSIYWALIQQAYTFPLLHITELDPHQDPNPLPVSAYLTPTRPVRFPPQTTYQLFITLRRIFSPTSSQHDDHFRSEPDLAITLCHELAHVLAYDGTHHPGEDTPGFGSWNMPSICGHTRLHAHKVLELWKLIFPAVREFQRQGMQLGEVVVENTDAWKRNFVDKLPCGVRGGYEGYEITNRGEWEVWRFVGGGDERYRLVRPRQRVRPRYGIEWNGRWYSAHIRWISTAVRYAGVRTQEVGRYMMIVARYAEVLAAQYGVEVVELGELDTGIWNGEVPPATMPIYVAGDSEEGYTVKVLVRMNMAGGGGKAGLLLAESDVVLLLCWAFAHVVVKPEDPIKAMEVGKKALEIWRRVVGEVKRQQIRRGLKGDGVVVGAKRLVFSGVPRKDWGSEEVEEEEHWRKFRLVELEDGRKDFEEIEAEDLDSQPEE